MHPGPSYHNDVEFTLFVHERPRDMHLYTAESSTCLIEQLFTHLKIAARRGNLGSGEAAPYRVALHSPILGSTEGGDSLGP